MKILMISAEAQPFAKTGGLADVVSALSKSLKKLGHDVKILIPRYYEIDRKNLTLVKHNVQVLTGITELIGSFYTSNLPNSDVPVYFFDYEPLFGRKEIYGSKFEPDFHDNPFRFSVLSRAMFSLCSELKWIPDIVHCHDWSACLSLVLLKLLKQDSTRQKLPLFKNFSLKIPLSSFYKVRTVLTIHNMGYQGKYPYDAFKLLGLPEELRLITGFEDNGEINFLKAGITCADKITTVSCEYAKEIQTVEGGFSLDGLIRIRSMDLTGILNGVDLLDWNPLTDKYICKNYSQNNLTEKNECKLFLQKKFGLEQNLKIPLIGMIGRLAEQKGIKEVFAPLYGCMYKMCKELNVQFVVVGTGETWCENEIRELSQKCSNLKYIIGYSEEISHQVESGSDFFLMPSKYEPCGLNQIYSMIYGTIPIVRNTGGLADTVVQYNEKEHSGTGFKFQDLTPEAIFNTVKYALEIYFSNSKDIEILRKTGMQADFSWEKSALKYIDVYNS